MENKKTPEMWFQKLKEPYRSEAIANIDNESINKYYTRIYDALFASFSWNESPQGGEYWLKISNSLEKRETTYIEPETLKPEQMESGKWYVVDTFLIKFKIISNDKIYRYKCYELQTRCDYSNNPDGFIEIQNNDIIRPATKEEVLKYFPDEVFEKLDEIIDTHVVQKIKPEPIELRPEDLVSGEVYRAKGTFDWIFIFSHIELGQVWHKKRLCLSDNTLSQNNGWFSDSIKFYHATPEEKALLGEETTDWEAKYNELKDEYKRLSDYDEELEKAAKEQSKLIETLRNELKEKESKEKVYFYLADMSLGWTFDINKECAINLSQSNYNIYEAIVIGKKKSVLVSENP